MVPTSSKGIGIATSARGPISGPVAIGLGILLTSRDGELITRAFSVSLSCNVLTTSLLEIMLNGSISGKAGGAADGVTPARSLLAAGGASGVSAVCAGAEGSVPSVEATDNLMSPASLYKSQYVV